MKVVFFLVFWCAQFLMCTLYDTFKRNDFVPKGKTLHGLKIQTRLLLFLLSSLRSNFLGWKSLRYWTRDIFDFAWARRLVHAVICCYCISSSLSAWEMWKKLVKFDIKQPKNFLNNTNNSNLSNIFCHMWNGSCVIRCQLQWKEFIQCTWKSKTLHSVRQCTRQNVCQTFSYFLNKWEKNKCCSHFAWVDLHQPSSPPPPRNEWVSAWWSGIYSIQMWHIFTSMIFQSVELFHVHQCDKLVLSVNRVCSSLIICTRLKRRK